MLLCDETHIWKDKMLDGTNQNKLLFAIWDSYWNVKQ